MNISVSAIRCSLQVAMLGTITQNLRAINVVLNERVFDLFFYYEDSPTEEEEISEIIASEVVSDFMNVTMGVTREILPISKPIPILGLRVYHRYEEIWSQTIK